MSPSRPLGLALIVCLCLTGCAGKSLDLYSPVTGKKVAAYRNKDNASEFKGLDAEFKADGSFRVHADSSAQDATAVPLAAIGLASQVYHDAKDAAINKIPSVPLVPVP